MTRHTSDPPEGLSRSELEALRWVVRMTSGEAGAAEQAELAEWCARSPENRTALASACRLWAATGPVLRAMRRSPARSQWRMLALAASLLLLVSLGYRLVSGREAAGPAVAQLADAGGYCRLLLGEGDASFDVTPDPGRTGAIDETRVRALGAAFSLKPSAAGVLVTVTGGQVEYKDGKGLHVIAAGQQMRCNTARHTAADAPRPEYGSPGRSARALLAALSDKLAAGQKRQLLRRMTLAASN